MDNQQSLEVRRIGIVGGGRVGHQLLTLFLNSQMTKLEYVVDVNASAPAMEAARRAEVKTFTNIESALVQPVDFIFEVTGNPGVVEIINRNIAHTKTSLVTHEMAFIILSVIGENNQKVKDDVVNEITGVKNQITKNLQGITELANDIGDITTQMNILSINARIEAARVGDQGKSFAVVAIEMAKSAERVKAITRQIEQVNSDIQNTSSQIEVSLNRLKVQ
jgi:hypothetical protein